MTIDNIFDTVKSTYTETNIHPPPCCVSSMNNRIAANKEK